MVGGPISLWRRTGDGYSQIRLISLSNLAPVGEQGVHRVLFFVTNREVVVVVAVAVHCE